MIINQLALIVNDFIINLQNKNIPFYIIILGMFIFNIIIYSIKKMFDTSINRRYFSR